jgi:hypothetical protein
MSNYNWRQMRRLMWLQCVLLALIVLSGCTYNRPYIEIGAAYQLDKNTDYWLQRERSWQCSNGIQGQLEVGTKIIHPVLGEGNHIRFGYHHESWLNCGKPFGNKKPEVYQDDLRLVYHYQF